MTKREAVSAPRGAYLQKCQVLCSKLSGKIEDEGKELLFQIFGRQLAFICSLHCLSGRVDWVHGCRSSRLGVMIDERINY